MNLIHQLWREQQQPKDEAEKRDFKEQEAMLTGKLTWVDRIGGDAEQMVDDWLPEGLPDSAPSWW